MNPIGHINSVFKFKNGTPRQSGVCQSARGTLQIEKSVFNNPEHSLQGLEQFSHVWIIFLFHKNNNRYFRAKVRPPRLNGQRLGVFSTRAPYRPNPVGLTLAKLDKIEGPTLHLSGVDILDGTPVLDIKPFIPQYDCPVRCDHHNHKNLAAQYKTDEYSLNVDDSDNDHLHISQQTHFHEDKNHGSDVSLNNAFTKLKHIRNCSESPENSSCKSEINSVNSLQNSDELESPERQVNSGWLLSLDSLCCDNRVHKEMSGICQNEADTDCMPQAELVVRKNHTSSHLLSWPLAIIDFERPVDKYNENYQEYMVRNHSKLKDDSKSRESQCVIDKEAIVSSPSTNQDAMLPYWVEQSPVSRLEVCFTPRAEEQILSFSFTTTDHKFQLKHLKDAMEAKQAIIDILQEDPRSVYRRQNCKDSLYYFTVDQIHVTCWFDDDSVEIVRIKPISSVPQLCSTLGV